MFSKLFRRDKNLFHDYEKILSDEEIHTIIKKVDKDNAADLDLSSSGIKELPQEIYSLNSLQSLNLSGNKQLSRLSPEIKNLTNLHTLKIGYTGLTQYPNELWQLNKLNHLDLSGNKHKILPSEIGQLTNLQHLELLFNKIPSLPKEIKNLLHNKMR